MNVKHAKSTKSVKHNKKTLEILDAAKEVLEASKSPMTVRQTYYQLVTKHIIENSKPSYSKVSRILGDGRIEGDIAWGLIEDRVRIPKTVNTWDNLPDFFETVKQAYRKNLWLKQGSYVEVEVEKDALSGIFYDTLNPYGVTLQVSRGYDSLTSMKNMADRLIAKQQEGKECFVLSFGDFDPSGEDIFRNMQEGLQKFGAIVTCKRCAILSEDIASYNLPPDIAKQTDKRCSTFVDKNGEDTVELDALPLDVLTQRIKDEVEACLDIDLFNEAKEEEAEEVNKLQDVMDMLNRMDKQD